MNKFKKGVKENPKNIVKALNYIHKRDFVSLKSVYNDLFQKIIVESLHESKIQLKFVFNENRISLTSC